MPPNAMKAPAKRTAFGDVSNTSRTVSAYDDSIIASKKAGELVKPILNEKPSALLRPAQRPLTATSAKLSSFGTNNNTSSDPIAAAIAAKISLIESKPLAPLPKRALSKRATSIYKDTNADHASSAPDHQSQGPRQHKSQPELKADQAVIRRTQSKINENSYSFEASREGEYQDASEQQFSDYSQQYNEVNASSQEEEQVIAENAFDLQQRELPPNPYLAQVEEYSEEEEEIYDEQGYTTAHSYRSRGENTTGGVTTVLFPKITNKAKKELAEAKELVESARTMEEIEDEAWDTSMVAEYGDEIFAYMRELEVSQLKFIFIFLMGQLSSRT
jgi:G2/mitotic-specific cyclin 3/4